MTFGIDNPEGGCNNPPLGKNVWEKPSGEQGLISQSLLVFLFVCLFLPFFSFF